MAWENLYTQNQTITIDLQKPALRLSAFASYFYPQSSKAAKTQGSEK